MSKIVIESLTKKYNQVVAVDDVSFELKAGEFLTLLGPSGCGKTTTLRCVAGLEYPDAGEITIGDAVVSSAARSILLPPEKRNVGMVFQSYAIWPNMTVFDNVAFGLSIRKTPKEKLRERVQEVLRQVRMDEYAGRYATELSGGQQQRVAVARALAFNPRALLFDEPLSNLDAKLREEMRVELLDIQKRIGITTLYVTHDQVEAMAISDRIAVMDKGKIVQMGSPEEIYNKPVNTFVAGFIGTTNLVRGRVLEAPAAPIAQGIVEFGGENETVRIHCSFPGEIVKSGQVMLSMRPEHLSMSPWISEAGPNTFTAKVSHKLFLGDCVSYYLTVGGHDFRAKSPSHIHAAVGSEVSLAIDPAHVVVVPCEV